MGLVLQLGAFVVAGVSLLVDKVNSVKREVGVMLLVKSEGAMV